MNRAEALEHFQNHIAGELCEKANEEFHLLFMKNRELFRDKLLQGFKAIIKQLEDTKDETEIGYIHFSFLRVHVLDGTYQWYVEAQNEKGVFDRVERSVIISMHEFCKPLEKLEMNLKKQISDYAGKITESDIENIKLKEFNRYIGYFYIGGLRTFQNIKNTDEYKKLKKAPLFRITLGERKDKCIILHITFPEALRAEEVLDKLYADPEVNGMNNEELTHRDLSGLHLEDRRVIFKNAVYSVFQDLQMDGAEVMFCNFTGADFTGASIRNSYMDVCTFQDASFENAVISDTVLAANHFELSGYEKGKSVAAGIYPVSFRGSEIQNVDFSGSDLSGCDFTNARISNVNFQDAKLEGTRFERKTAEHLVLTEEQRNSICII